MRLLLVLILLITMFTVTAQPDLVITPSPFDDTVFINDHNQIEFNFYNNGTTELYNITYLIDKDDQLFSFPIIRNITDGANITRNMSVYPETEFDKSYTIVMGYVYYLNETPDPVTHEINVDGSGFSPNYLEVNTGDTITWINIDNSNHSVKDLSHNEFGSMIQVGKNYSYTFNNIKEYSYFDQNYTGLTGKINVTQTINKVLTHTPNLDVILTGRVKSIFAESKFSVNLFIDFLRINHDQTGEGVFEIINTGNSTIKNITFDVIEGKTDWLSFENITFDIPKDQNKIVEYFVTPNITETDETNKSYKIKFTVNSINSPSITKELDIFVEHHDFGIINLNDTCIVINELSIDDTIDFCLTRPNHGNCHNLVEFCVEYPNYGNCKQLYKEKIVEVPKEIGLKEEEVQSMIQSNKEEGNILQRWDNKFTTVFTDVQKLRENVDTLVQKQNELELEQQQLETEKKEEEKKETVSKFVRIFIGVVIGMIILGFIFIKFMAKRGLEHEMVRLSHD